MWCLARVRRTVSNDAVSLATPSADGSFGLSGNASNTSSDTSSSAVRAVARA